MTSKTIVVILAMLALSAIVASFAGCDLGDMLRVKTPVAIQQSTGLPASLPLNEAEAEYRTWTASVKEQGARWKENLERSNEIRGMLSQLTLSAFDTIGPTLGGIPVLAPVLPAATGLLMYFLGAGKLRKEKEASFNAGQKKAAELNRA